ncbi:MAG: hypothetical protein HQL08_06610 [Nitrospirae bacterium]|nr:hypothetical protein [Nitrospirota bacterium]
MKRIQIEKIELFARKYIIDIGIAVLCILFALVFAERPKADHRLIGKDGKSQQAVPGKVSARQTPENAAGTIRPVTAKEGSKSPDPSDFYADEFLIQEKDARKLCEVIRSDSYKLGAMNAAFGTIEWLNELLKVGDLFDKVVYEKPDLVLTNEIKGLKEQTEVQRVKPFAGLKDDEQKKIKRLNRLILVLAYPLETPKSRNLEVRNIFEPDGNYEKPKELIIIPEKPYNLIAVLEGKEKRAILRDYTGRTVSLKTGDKMIDGSVVISIDKVSVTAKKGKKEMEYRIFNVKNKKGKA